MLGSAAVYSRALGFSASWEDVFAIAAGVFLILTVLLRRRETARLDTAVPENRASAALARSRTGLVLVALAVILFILALCFDLLKR